MNAMRRRASDHPHPAYTPGVGLVMLANLLLWTALALALHGCLA